MLEYDDIIGITGTITLIMAYYLTISKVVERKPILVDILNIYGSFGVGFNCIIKKTYPPLFLEIAWIIIGFLSLFRNIKLNYKNKKEFTPKEVNMRISTIYESI